MVISAVPNAIAKVTALNQLARNSVMSWTSSETNRHRNIWLDHAHDSSSWVRKRTARRKRAVVLG